ncbi:acetylornithine deacetylase [Laetiporus sulphureus 93-53]|uniref:Acetylornithine deacetylase n=1 Tax=Laetiporus sulphureus 93-53 TaxID=1314785 RepID=A0A165DDP5_9APHY|nr:acetylornithine deacetylase [Laetiporus sulphureus 93-53]KZT04652.1 acetylornithine deacetylase [Laetiporus sulphureus 93-53]
MPAEPSKVPPSLTEVQVSAIRRAAADLLPECAKFLASLIQIDTTNPPGKNYPECAQLIGNTLKSFGYTVEYVEVPVHQLPTLAPSGEGLRRVNVIGRLSGSDGAQGKTLHVNGHFDVVPIGTAANWKYPPFGGEVHNGRMYGRGTADMKGGIAAQACQFGSEIFAVEAIKRAGLRLEGNIEQSGVVDEETTGIHNAGMGFLVDSGHIRADKIDAVVITEPLNTTNVCCGHRGTIWGAITFRGRLSHGSMPGLGINALHHACTFVHLATTTLCPKLASRVDESVIPAEARMASLAFTILKAGDNINSVPDIAVVHFDRRIVPGETLANARKEIMDILTSMNDREDCTGLDYEYKEEYATEATWVDPKQPISLIFQDAIKVVTGQQAGIRFLVHSLRPAIESTIVYGPGYISEAHIADESIDLEKELKVGMEVMALAFATFLGVDEIQEA